MRKTKLLPILIVALMLTDLPPQTFALGIETTTVSGLTNISATTAIGRKRKGYRAKRGGLFNTGLFRKKNACGCPNH